jgi:small subunit ribosomal protein S4
LKKHARLKGVKGENLIKLLEARLDNTIFRMGLAASRPEARQLVAHKHIAVNGEVTNVPSYTCKPGDVITYRSKSAHNTSIVSKQRPSSTKFSWVDWNPNTNTGTFIAMPEREAVPENIKEQLIVELYSK